MDYERVADLPVTIDGYELSQHDRHTSSGFERVTTTVTLRGEGLVGRGEDVTYDAEDHHALAASALPALAGEYTIDSFSETLSEMNLFPSGPQRPPSRRYRRWAFESAALDLALRQADRSLADVFERDPDPVQFVVSTRLGEPPTIDRVDRLREVSPDVALKLDPTADWTAALIDDLAETEAVEILDLKGQYAHADVHQPANPRLYEQLLAAFPEAIIEDPAFSEGTASRLRAHADRLSWDVPITDASSLSTLPVDPAWINVKPSRIGTIEALCGVISYCTDHDISMYGGGQFELGVGRTQIQTLAALFYPTGPNDVAPAVYNDPDVPESPPQSPLDVDVPESGFTPT
ncbi:hypothetical protein [Halorhabdus sp. CUG00001]|uniref:hypothetical protein n=1 Tax=Halorhabdus sp. CUG00001 TaxID=2600297 RepID=UPI00131B6754|nr:hypothetical protein [Halorhabdus sp. CUG00001]